MQRDGLVKHVQLAGRSALTALQSMQARHSIIGAAQGQGYLLGLELVDPKTRRPSAKVATAVAEACLRRGVCTSPVGPALRVSPMVVASEAIVLRTYEIVEAAIADVEERS